MTPSIETSIWLALKSRIESLPLTFARAWPGQKFEPPRANGLPQPFLSIGRVSAAPRRLMVKGGQDNQRTGFLMVTLVHPLGQNVAVYDELAGKIAQHFVDGTEARFGGVCVSITEYPHVQDGFEENGYWMVPIRVPWRCFG